MNQEHGSPFDRGSADSWYRRPKYPHYRDPKTWRLILRYEMTDEQIAEYKAGYEDNEKRIDSRKDYA